MIAVKACKCFSAALFGESVCSTICSISCFLFMLSYSSLVLCGPLCHTQQRISVWMTHIASCTHTVSLKDLLDQPYIHWPTRRSTSTQPADGLPWPLWR